MTDDLLKNQQKEIQILVFQLAEHFFSFDMKDLSAVTRVLAITPVARSADFFEGLINLRGRLTPVIDLRSLLMLPKKAHDANTRLLALKGDGYQLCVLVDSVYSVIKADSSLLEEPPEILFSEYIKTVYKKNDKLILILNAHKLVDAEEVKSIIQARGKDKLIVTEEEVVS
ncbi:MAG: chemotaxis protein CheW [SAR324 cluster bacterium]|nr:chemotaxis protein CheW [SAR324 cluster bacterium]